jgi:undecaprenyl-diphosphatase
MTFMQLDFQVFQMINNLARTVSFLNPLMRVLAGKTEYLFFLGIIIYWFTRIKQNRRMVATALLSACIAFSISGVLAHFFYRDRPFVTHTVQQLIDHAVNASFPSDHAIGAFVIATSIWLFRKREGTLWLVLAACIGFSRIWTGVHYPSDVLAGTLIGITSAAGVHALLARWSVFQQPIDAAIRIYENLEQKIWPKSPSLRNHRS